VVYFAHIKNNHLFSSTTQKKKYKEYQLITQFSIEHTLLFLASTYVPTPERCSIIGDEGLDFQVRNGSGYFPLSKDTRKSRWKHYTENAFTIP
jgi:hypothetical protein